METMKNDFVDISICGELNYRLFLSVIKHELDKLGYADIAAVQALILMNLGDNVVTITEVMSRGYYIGSNASYNIRRLVANGYISQSPSDYDKRAVLLQTTAKGEELCLKVNAALSGHIKKFEQKMREKLDMKRGLEFLRNVERAWKDFLQDAM